MRPQRIHSPEAGKAGSPQAGSRYRDNLARHLIGISRDLESRVMQSLREECGFLELRPSFGPFLSLIWDEGRPLSNIASKLAISNQACSQLANLAEGAGYLERRPNPTDRRSKLVMLTSRGHTLVEQGVQIILASESDYEALVGPTAYRRFTTALGELYAGLGLPTHSDPVLTARARRSVGVLPLIGVEIQRVLMEATIARGHEGLKMSHGQVLPLIGTEGARIHEIARIQRVSRQAISTTTHDLEALGYLERQPDPRDRRGIVLTLTSRGRQLIEDSVAAVDGLELSFGEILGRGRLVHLQQVARDLYHALNLEAEIFESGIRSKQATGETDDLRVQTKRNDRDIEQLAEKLRGWLGSDDTARLAEVLEPSTRRHVA